MSLRHRPARVISSYEREQGKRSTPRQGWIEVECGQPRFMMGKYSCPTQNKEMNFELESTELKVVQQCVGLIHPFMLYRLAVLSS